VKIATWNVNSVKARQEHVAQWLQESLPDVLLLQEIKCQTPDFPAQRFADLGYQSLAVGQKSYNGVAVLSRVPFEPILTALPGDETDEQSRYLEIDCQGIRIACLYLPNGNPVETEKYPYKLSWMRRLTARARTLLAMETPFLMAGDYNICPEDTDVYDPLGWRNDALCRPESRAEYRKLIHLGLTDAVKIFHPEPHYYSFWDYQAGAWPRNLGLRIDHLLLSPALADRLTDAGIDRGPRAMEKASDHTPAWCTLA
jgi:exodeoxyribonuclease-3